LEFAFRRLTHACSILMANDAVPVVFDMETQDPDDFLCLLFLASHPRVRLKAVTLVPGSPEQVGLVRWALGALGLDDDRVAVGAGDLVSKPASVSPWHARAFGDHAPSTNAEEAWRVLVRECDGRTVLFTGGPLTNVAEAIAHGGDAFVAGCWLAQGGFAGDNVVPAEKRLPKFDGRTMMATWNFGANLPAARAALAHRGFGRIRLVSKNVCHADTNRFGPEQFARLEASLKAHGGSGGSGGDVTAPTLVEATRRQSEASGEAEPTSRHRAGLGLLHVGMAQYLRRHPAGKLLHDPLAAACVIDGRVIDAWREVRLEEDRQHRWGCKPADGSGTFISASHDPARFWSTLLADGARSGPRDSGPHNLPAAADRPTPRAEDSLAAACVSADGLNAPPDCDTERPASAAQADQPRRRRGGPRCVDTGWTAQKAVAT